MRIPFSILVLLLRKGNVLSSELPAEKENKVQMQFNYSRCYNYRYARMPFHPYRKSYQSLFLDNFKSCKTLAFTFMSSE